MGKGDTHIAVTWRARFLAWSDTWPTNGPLVSGRRRSSFRMLRATMGLADEAGADGRLHGKRDWWTLEHLAARMRLSRNTAREVLAWLEENGWLSSQRQAITRDGTRQPDMRHLTIPHVQRSISELDEVATSKTVGVHVQESAPPRPKIPASTSNGHIPALDQSVDTEIRSYVEDGAEAKASSYLTPRERWEKTKGRVVA